MRVDHVQGLVAREGDVPADGRGEAVVVVVGNQQLQLEPRIAVPAQVDAGDQRQVIGVEEPFAAARLAAL